MSDDPAPRVIWPLVEIVWVDSCSPRGWTFLDEVLEQKVSNCQSVGYLVNDGKDHKTIAASVDLANGFRNPHLEGVMHIPIVSIISVRVIEKECT